MCNLSAARLPDPGSGALPAVAWAWQPVPVGLAIQGVVDLANNNVIYHEVLARFASHATQEQRTALIARLEAEGSIHHLDREVLGRALACLDIDPRLRLGVNISCRTIDLARGALVEMIESTGGAAERLVLEITETAPLVDRRGFHVLAERARSAGCMLAFDDFGAGWFTLADIAEYGPDIVKIDGALFRRWFEAGAGAAAVLEELAIRGSIMLVAEHIESAEMAGFARAHGILLGQGFHFGQPFRLAA